MRSKSKLATQQERTINVHDRLADRFLSTGISKQNRRILPSTLDGNRSAGGAASSSVVGSRWPVRCILWHVSGGGYHQNTRGPLKLEPRMAKKRMPYGVLAMSASAPL